ncbi:MAG: YggS family pyridoxal phosphate-dependent enzyme [Pseudomonadales bacterium]|nr:YggS family pyridoxal phosphate-dependent enzyme [Pseudomonadales bacterium]
MNYSVTENLAAVNQQISEFCTRHQRAPGSVRLLAVSKTKPLSAVLAAAAAGQTDFGENYLQDALPKITATRDQPGICWHYIGAIQSNKTRPIAEHFSWVHTVASSKIARRLNDQRPAELPPLNVLIQVNIDRDPAKAGVMPEDLPGLIEETLPMAKIRLRGLMTLPSERQKPEEQRVPFATLRNLLLENQQHFSLADFDQLSMGMSGDMEAAIAEGSTWVRIGTAIFGARETRPAGSPEQ